MTTAAAAAAVRGVCDERQNATAAGAWAAIAAAATAAQTAMAEACVPNALNVTSG